MYHLFVGILIEFVKTKFSDEERQAMIVKLRETDIELKATFDTAEARQDIISRLVRERDEFEEDVYLAAMNKVKAILKENEDSRHHITAITDEVRSLIRLVNITRYERDVARQELDPADDDDNTRPPRPPRPIRRIIAIHRVPPKIRPPSDENK